MTMRPPPLLVPVEWPHMPRRAAQISPEYQALRASFQQLAHSIGRIGSLLAQAAAVDGVGARNAGRPHSRRKPRLSAKQRAALKLQGEYMGTIRGLKPLQRSKVKKPRRKGYQGRDRRCAEDGELRISPSLFR